MKYLLSILVLSFNFSLYAQALPPILTVEEIEFENKQFENQMEMAKKLSSGADIVGNGAGRIEIMANYYLRQLDQTISDCLNSKTCHITKADRFVLKEIRNISLESRVQNKKLIFLNGIDFENIFNSPNDPEIRIAKTGYHKKYPIFFNLTELYKTDLDIIDRNLIAILIHELGHQTGIKSHTYLDELAARLSFYFEQKLNRIKYNHQQTELILTTLNNRGSFDFSKSYLSINQQVFEINYIAEKLKCINEKDKTIGINLENAHWKKIKLTASEKIITLGFWATVYCENTGTKEIQTQSHEIIFHLNFDSKNQNEETAELVLNRQEIEIIDL